MTVSFSFGLFKNTFEFHIRYKYKKKSIWWTLLFIIDSTSSRQKDKIKNLGFSWNPFLWWIMAAFVDAVSRWSDVVAHWSPLRPNGISTKFNFNINWRGHLSSVGRRLIPIYLWINKQFRVRHDTHHIPSIWLIDSLRVSESNKNAICSAHSGHRHQPNHVDGKFFIYFYASGRVLCAAHNCHIQFLWTSFVCRIVCLSLSLCAWTYWDLAGCVHVESETLHK